MTSFKTIQHSVVEFINCVSRAQFHQRSSDSFYAPRSRMRKNRQSSQHCHFTFLGSASVKVVRWTLMKSTLGVNFTNKPFKRIFYVHRAQRHKKTVKSSVSVFIYALLDTTECAMDWTSTLVNRAYFGVTFEHFWNVVIFQTAGTGEKNCLLPNVKLS